MQLSLMFNVSLQFVQAAVQEFEDLILGFQSNDVDHVFAINQSNCVPISQIEELGERLKNCKGEIIEICVEEPEQLDACLSYFLGQQSFEPAVVLGAELSRWENVEGLSGIVVANKNAEELLFAAKQFVQSKAVKMIVIPELFLKGNFHQARWKSLTSLKKQLQGSDGNIVLLNPKTPERKIVLSELSIICSRQIEIIAAG